MLVHHMKDRLASPQSRGSRQPIDLAGMGDLGLDKFLSQLSLHQTTSPVDGGVVTDSRLAGSAVVPQQTSQALPPPNLPMKQSKKRSTSGGQLPGLSSVSSMPDLSDCHKSDTSSDDARGHLHGGAADKSSAGALSPSRHHKPRKSNLSGRQKSKTELTPSSNNSSKNLNVRFDPNQVPDRSPYNERHHESGKRHRSGHHHRTSGGHHHRNRSSSRTGGGSRAVREVSRTGSLPRSHSYSGRSGFLQDGPNGPGVRPMDEEDEMSDDCSTCSSSSSDSDDPYAYQLPPRRAYGGVRISYVPNDRFAMSQRHATGRSSLRVPGAQSTAHLPSRGSPSLSVAQPGSPLGHPLQPRLRGVSLEKEKDKNCIIS